MVGFFSKKIIGFVALVGVSLGVYVSCMPAKNDESEAKAGGRQAATPKQIITVWKSYDAFTAANIPDSGRELVVTGKSTSISYNYENKFSKKCLKVFKFYTTPGNEKYGDVQLVTFEYSALAGKMNVKSVEPVGLVEMVKCNDAIPTPIIQSNIYKKCIKASGNDYKTCEIGTRTFKVFDTIPQGSTCKIQEVTNGKVSCTKSQKDLTLDDLVETYGLK